MRALLASALAAAVLAAGGASAGPGGEIVFARMVGQQFELFKVRPDGSQLVRLTRNGLDDEEPEWSPDGRRLLALANGQIVIRSSSGPLVRRLPVLGFETSWSPDARLIAYLRAACSDPKLGDSCADLWIVVPGRAPRRLATAEVDLTVASRPYAWSPDGRRIVYLKLGSPGELVIVDVRTGRKSRLGPTRKALSTDPSWSPDGRWIAFSRQRAAFAGSDLYAVSPSGTRLHRLARGRSISRATWSPNGRAIAYFNRVDEERFALLVARRDGKRPRRIAFASLDSELVWSPDSTRVLWNTGYERLVTAKADGRGRAKVIAAGRSPDWR